MVSSFFRDALEKASGGLYMGLSSMGTLFGKQDPLVGRSLRRDPEDMGQELFWTRAIHEVCQLLQAVYLLPKRE